MQNCAGTYYYKAINIRKNRMLQYVIKGYVANNTPKKCNDFWNATNKMVQV